ncbi:MAG: globin domain-containing protein [Verrucomicrobiales bacterium]
MEETIFQQLGEDGFERLIAAFYRRVKTDDLIGPMYPDDDWEGSEKRLRDFLVGRFGGPQRYIEERGHPRLRMRHAPFPIGEAERDRWLELMSASLDEAEIADAPKAVLLEFFSATAGFMRNQ